MIYCYLRFYSLFSKKNQEVVKIKISCFFDGTYASNCYLVTSDDEKHSVVIDPSVSYDFVFRQRGSIPTVDGIILTHTHFDHVLCLSEWKNETGAPVYINELDAESLSDGEKNGYSVFFGEQRSYGKADVLLKDGDTVEFGDERLSLLHTPGHTAGSSCFVGDEVMFTGDTIFADGGYGRTDLYSGSPRQLFSSLKKLFSLDKNYIIFPGHGAESTLEDEKTNHGFNSW